MGYNIILTHEAQLDETNAYNYYESVQQGLGEVLLENLYDKYQKNG